jgi:hypothetical protein
MGFLKLKHNDKVYINDNDILRILKQEEFYWLIDSEVDGADVEIKKSTLIWNSGTYLSGDWHYGIFKDGNFFGNWLNGIFEGGNFNGNWYSGIDYTNTIKK